MAWITQRRQPANHGRARTCSICSAVTGLGAASTASSTASTAAFRFFLAVANAEAPDPSLAFGSAPAAQQACAMPAAAAVLLLEVTWWSAVRP